MVLYRLFRTQFYWFIWHYKDQGKPRSISLDNENECDNERYGNETDEVPSNRKKTMKKPSAKKQNWSSPKSKSRLKHV